MCGAKSQRILEGGLGENFFSPEKGFPQVAAPEIGVIDMKERFLAVPHCPENTVSRVMMSDRMPSAVRALQQNHIHVITAAVLDHIHGAERFHADMSVCTAGGEHLFVAAQLSADNRAVLCREGFILHETKQPVTARCPSLNICVLGDTVLCYPPTADAGLLDYLQQTGRRILTVRQRYTKCSVAVVNAHAIITADAGIAKVCRQNAIDVLKITEGYIDLEGYPYGFIGGCCGLLSRDTLAFSGRIEQHPDYRNMKDFARQYGVSLVSLSGQPLYDIGGILPLAEYDANETTASSDLL